MKRRSLRLLLNLAFLAALILPAEAVAANRPAVSNSNSPSNSEEARTERYFQSIRKDPNLLLAFLREMPKGADLHIHLTGSVYAESYIQWAADEGECIDGKTLY